MAFTTREDRESGLELRSIGFDAEQVLARIYFAARDPQWRTARMQVQHRERVLTPHGFASMVEAESVDPLLPLTASLRATADGQSLTVETSCTALADFPYNRIGPCLLFDERTFRGAPATSEHNGTTQNYSFPDDIAARRQRFTDAAAFHTPFTRLTAELASGTRLEIRIAGDDLEFEDQRNWTDASYKAYTTAVAPLVARAGQRFEHRVQLTVSPGEPTSPAERSRIQIGATLGRMPPVGIYDGTVDVAAHRPAGGFPELNEHPPVLAPRSVQLGVNGAVHAVDDDSVLETASLHGTIVRQARTLAGGAAVHLGPVSFLDVAGDWLDATGAYSPEPPANGVPERWAKPLAATWVVASAASAAPLAPASLRYFSPDLPVHSPAAAAIERLAGWAGLPLREVRVPAPLLAIAVEHDDLVMLAVSNPSPDHHEVGMPDGTDMSIDPFSTEWMTLVAALQSN